MVCPLLVALAALAAEPVAPNLVATLARPDRPAVVSAVRFSPDGRRLLGSGYPSGLVQIWDVTSRKEVRRFDTPAGLRASDDYARLTPDWKTLYVPVERWASQPIFKRGQQMKRREVEGQIRVWDMGSGVEREPLLLPPDRGGDTAFLDPTGRWLVAWEQGSHDGDEPSPRRTAVWDLRSRQRRELGDDYHDPSFAPDGKTFVTSCVTDHRAKTSTLTAFESATLKVLAAVEGPAGDRWFFENRLSPDGQTVAVLLVGRKGGPLEVQFRDARTLDLRGTLTRPGNPDRYGWSPAAFTPDGGRYVAVDAGGNVVVWDVARG